MSADNRAPYFMTDAERSEYVSHRNDMSAETDPKWKIGPRVRVDALKRGDMFSDINGHVWRYSRPDGALRGAHHVIATNGIKTCFAGCAEVVRLP